jgi:formylglycine-generating enzyme required for sulfatase activity/TolB-like protein
MNKRQPITSLKIIVLAFIFLAAGILPLAAQGKPRLAILPFTGGTGGDAETIAEFFSQEVELNRVFTPAPRTSAVASIMKEQQFQRSGLTDADTIARLGKMSNADYVLAGHITSLGKSNLLVITIFHVEQLRQVAGDYREYQTIESVAGLMGDMARRIGQAVRIDASRLPGLAVLPFNVPAGVNAQDAEVLAQLLATEVANSGKYAVFPRTSSIEKIMEEQHIERSGLTDPDSIRKIGAGVNAQYVLSASVRSLGKDTYFSGSILDIEEGTQGAAGRIQYQTINEGIRLMPDLSAPLLRAVPKAAVVQVTAKTPEQLGPWQYALIEKGTFSMGSPSSERNRENDEVQHKVTVNGFYLGKYEVTQEEWVALMGNNPSNFKGANLPVEKVNWFDAVEYCNRRSQQEGLTPVYTINGENITWKRNANGYRLPTEAEWEYACRAGTAAAYSTGADISTSQAAYGLKSTSAIGRFRPNAWGLFDMHGNVYEWCWDLYDDYGGGAQTNPVGPSAGSDRIGRGGAWGSDVSELRSAYRGSFTPSLRGNLVGFRLARSL